MKNTFVDFVDSIPSRIRKARCNHHYVKHYGPKGKTYVGRCSKCEKVIGWPLN